VLNSDLRKNDFTLQKGLPSVLVSQRCFLVSTLEGKKPQEKECWETILPPLKGSFPLKHSYRDKEKGKKGEI